MNSEHPIFLLDMLVYITYKLDMLSIPLMTSTHFDRAKLICGILIHVVITLLKVQVAIAETKRKS